MGWILNRLRRITLTTAYLPEIDGLRFIAIAAVIFCHLASDLVYRHGLEVQNHSNWLFNVALHGERGVRLFFTISGFILALPFARRYLAGNDRPDLWRYFRRRLLRLEPPYLLNVVVISIATWVVTARLRPVLIWHFLTAATYSHLLIFHYVNPINMIWWSLEIELQFYILMPVLALVFKIRQVGLRRTIMMAAAFTAFIWQGAVHTWIVDMTILGHIQYFLVGLLAADLYLSNTLSKLRSTTFDLLGSLSVVFLFALPDSRSIHPTLTLFIIFGALNGRFFRNFLSLPWISAIGSMCYTIYLWHVFVMASILKVTLRLLVPKSFVLSIAIQAAIIVPALFVFSVVLFLAIEKPCMQPEWPTAFQNFLRGLLRKPQTHVAFPETGQESSVNP